MPVSSAGSRRSARPVGASSSVGLAVAPAVALALALALGGCSSSSEVTSAASTTAPAGATSTAKDARTTTTADPASDDAAGKTTTTDGSSADDATSDDSSADEATSDDGGVTPACDLLTEEDVTEALGEPVVPGDQRTDECWWSTENDLKTVNLIRRTDEDLETWREGYDNPQWEAADFGDEGYRGKTLDSIVFRIGDTIYEVNVVFSTKGDPDVVVESLAEQVLTRL